MPEKADGVPLAYVGKDTRSATPLILTLGASGGDIIGSLAKDRPLQVLLVDSDGNHLIKTAFGITGWAQQGEDGDSETFPALKTVQDVHYNPELGTPLDEHYHRLEAGEPLRPGKIDGDEYPDSTHYHRLLQTALTPGGSSWYIEHGHDEHYRFFRLNSPDARLADDDERAIGEADSLTLPGNGAIYSEGKDENHYFRTWEKWLLRGKPQRVPQPAYYLGKDSTYHGMLQRQQQAHSDLSEVEKKAVPLPLTDRIGGTKTVAEIAPESSVRLILAQEIPCKAAQPRDCSDTWLLIQTADGKTGWVNIDYQDGKPFPDIE